MNGVINVYKETGVTSFGVVAKIRKLLNVSKCGHLGTLDPMAEGVLPVCIGYATRFSDYLSSVDKEYVAEFILGFKSASYDNTSELEKVSDKVVDKSEIENAGSREMDIYSNTLINYEYPYGVIRVSCGKGTYIRSIINTMGERLGCGAVMSGLIRSANGIFSSQKSFKISQLESMVKDGSIETAITPVYELLDWGRAVIKDSAIKQIKHGISPDHSAYINLPIEHTGDNFFIMDNKSNLIAVAERIENSSFPLKLKIVINN